MREGVGIVPNTIVRQARLSAERTERITSEFFFIGIYLLSFTLHASINVPFHLMEHTSVVHLQFYIHLHADWPFHVFVQSYGFSQHVGRVDREGVLEKVRIKLNSKTKRLCCVAFKKNESTFQYQDIGPLIPHPRLPGIIPPSHPFPIPSKVVSEDPPLRTQSISSSPDETSVSRSLLLASFATTRL